jgi:predicted PurR-regulated permease PerM
MQKFLTKDLIITLILLVGLFFIKDALSPLVIAIILAYLCGPLAKILNIFLPRALSSLLALLLVISFLTSLVWHLIVSQDFLALKFKLDQIAKSNLAQGLSPYFIQFKAFIINKLAENVQAIIANLLSSTQSLIAIASNLILAPFLAFYFLEEIYFKEKNLQGFLGKIIKYLDLLIKNFCQIQVTLAIIYSFYAVLLLFILKIDNPLSLGLFYGISYLIPYLGFIFSIIIISLLTFLQYGFDYQIIILILAFLTLTFLDSWIINPKLVAPKLGLSPLSSLIAVIVTGKIFGLLGMIFALPLGVVVQDTIKFIWFWDESVKKQKVKKEK